MESIKDIENNIKRFQIPNQNIIRNRSIPIINSYTSWSSKKHWFDSELQNLEKSTNVFLTKNPDLLLTKADKGNITVAFEKTEYVSKINQMLLDKDTYSTLAINPMNKIVNSIKGLLTRWKKMEYISLATYRNLYCSDGILPRAYGLPKVHKPDCPFRIIISSIDSPLYSLANFLHNIINKGMPKAKTHINNSFSLLKILSGLKLENETCLISLDAVSLFTNIPIDLAMDCLTKRWNLFSSDCKIPKNESLNAVRLVLDSTFFTFDNRFYKQNFGTSMGFPLSPIIADVVMQELETTVLSAVNFQIPIHFRYVDDILMAVPQDKIDYILNVFNSFHSRLQFTLEVGGKRINFLDTTIILDRNKIKIDWYQHFRVDF